MTKKDVSNEDIMTALAQFAQSVDQRFDAVDERFDAIDKHLFVIEGDIEGIKTRLTKLEESHQHLLNTVDKFIARIDTYETELAARDSQFQKLLDWARKVSEKTGIPLENL